MRKKEERSKPSQTNNKAKHHELPSVLAHLGALAALAVLFHRIRTISAAYYFRPPLSTSGSALVHLSKRLWVRVTQVELNFLLCTYCTLYNGRSIECCIMYVQYMCILPVGSVSLFRKDKCNVAVVSGPKGIIHTLQVHSYMYYHFVLSLRLAILWLVEQNYASCIHAGV